MKKLLLFSTIALCSAGAFAADYDYSEFYKVYFDGKEVENGSTIICTDYTSMYDAKLTIQNQIIGLEQPIFIRYEFTDTPTQEEADADEEKWGFVSICEASGNCFADALKGAVGQLPANEPGNYVLDFEIQDCPKETVSKYKFLLSLCYEDVENGQTVYYPTEDTEDDFECYIVFAPTQEAGVGNLVEDLDETPVYYNMQGMRVAETTNGIYIVKKGNKTTKQIIRK